MSDTSDAISDLQSRWETLNDFDRARAIRAIHNSGTSFNKLAKALKRSASLLRRLVDSLQALPEDQLLARKGEITTNELVRRAKAAKISQNAKDDKALELRRAQESIRGCKEICDWLRMENLPGSLSEQIILEAQRKTANAEQAGKLPRDAAPAGMPVNEIIQRCRPAPLKTDASTLIDWFGGWLALWGFYSMPDSSVRYQAFELAYDKQFKR